MPLPLGGSRSASGQGGGGDVSVEDVEIPGAHRAEGPRFRQELLEAAKQRAPLRYEEAVKQYYKELIR